MFRREPAIATGGTWITVSVRHGDIIDDRCLALKTDSRLARQQDNFSRTCFAEDLTAVSPDLPDRAYAKV